jgi:hypothetical protein
MDEINDKSEASTSSAADESVDSAAKHEKPGSRLALLLVLVKLRIVLGVLIFLIKYCGGQQEEDRDSQGEARAEPQQGATTRKRIHFLPRLALRIMLFACKIVFFLIDLFIPKYIRDSAKSVSMRSHGDLKGISLPSDLSELLRQKDVTKSNGQEET